MFALRRDQDGGAIHQVTVRAFIILTASIFLAQPAAQWSASIGRVASMTDGDTVRLTSGERVRVALIDAPETQPGQAKWRAEIVRGLAAKYAAEPILADQQLAIDRVGRSYGRTVAELKLGRADVASLLVARGIARWWPRHTPKPDWCG